MVTPFGVGWDVLELQHITAFFEGRPEEGLTWEAKGTLLHPQSLLKHSCGFANQTGGWIILGVAQTEDEWVVEGADFPGGEAGKWVSSIIHNGLRPRPPVDVKEWPIPEAATRRVAVVQVSPVGDPPTITRTGAVYERVSGQTIPVTDPSVLIALQQRGTHARNGAEERTEKVLDRLLGTTWAGSRRAGILLAASTSAQAADLARTVFSTETLWFLNNLPATAGLLDDRWGKPASLSVNVTQHGLMAIGGPGVNAWTVFVGRHGQTGAMCATDYESFGIDLLWEDVVAPCARAIEATLARLGAYGATSVRAAAIPWSAPKPTVSTATHEAALTETRSLRWAEEPRLDDALHDELKREVLWAAGIPAFY